MKVAYLGPKGSFTHHVAKEAFKMATHVAFGTITDVIKAYEKGQVTYAIIPVENSIEGSVHESLDYLFHQGRMQSVAEVIQPIKQQLMMAKPKEAVSHIYSHPQALAQAKAYLQQHYPEGQLEVTASTAYAARFIAEHPDKPYAAIAPEQAADQYGLTIVARDIQEMDENFTRFWILGDRPPALSLPLEEQKVSLALRLPDNLPGALYKALSVFAWRGIDLTKIESRPLKTALGEYFFILDCTPENQQIMDYALEELASLGIHSKLLGAYPVYSLPITNKRVETKKEEKEQDVKTHTP